MTAERAVVLPPRREGRPSNAALLLENRTLRHALDTVTGERDDLDAELRAHVTERLDAATRTLGLARQAMRWVAAGHRPVQPLLDMERLALREQARALAARTPDDDDPAAVAA